MGFWIFNLYRSQVSRSKESYWSFEDKISRGLYPFPDLIQLLNFGSAGCWIGPSKRQTTYSQLAEASLPVQGETVYSLAYMEKSFRCIPIELFGL